MRTEKKLHQHDNSNKRIENKRQETNELDRRPELAMVKRQIEKVQQGRKIETESKKGRKA